MTLTKSELRVKFGYEVVGPFSGGLARAQKDGQQFHIRPDGQPAYQERYDEVYPFSEGLARARKGNQWFDLRPSGRKES